MTQQMMIVTATRPAVVLARQCPGLIAQTRGMAKSSKKEKKEKGKKGGCAFPYLSRTDETTAVRSQKEGHGAGGGRRRRRGGRGRRGAAGGRRNGHPDRGILPNPTAPHKRSVVCRAERFVRM